MRILELAAGPAHGYELAQTLSTLGFRRAALDHSIVYKLLRTLEERGFLHASWVPSEEGPPRRSYQLTEAGEAYLHERAADLKRQAQRIGQFLTRYAQQYPRIAEAEGTERGQHEGSPYRP